MSFTEVINDPPEAEAADARLRLHFRVLTMNGGRKGFRLEMIYWDALEVLARRNGRSLADEIDARLAGAPGHLNQSSALRAGLTADLLDLWTTAEAKVARPQWAGIVAALPSPAFVANRRSVLLAANEPLLTYLQDLRDGRALPLNTVQGAAGLSLEALPGAVANLAADPERRFVSCSVTFKAGAQRMTCKARLLPLDAAVAETPVLLGILETRAG